MEKISLPKDPLAVFDGSRTPPGLYARQKWRDESATPSWQADFQATVAELTRGRGSDGLWQTSPMETIRCLFGLHLTVREPDSAIRTSLDRLLALARDPAAWADTTTIDASSLQGLPFMPGPWPEILIPATLFLASIFNMAKDPTVIDLYADMCTLMGEAQYMTNAVPAAVHNRLRALVVHPNNAAHSAIRQAVQWMVDRQTDDGDWGTAIPFYQALNALAHLDSSLARRACTCAFTRLGGTQNEDGSWGVADREWNTFLTVHALKNGQVQIISGGRRSGIR